MPAKAEADTAKAGSPPEQVSRPDGPAAGTRRAHPRPAAAAAQAEGADTAGGEPRGGAIGPAAGTRKAKRRTGAEEAADEAGGSGREAGSSGADILPQDDGDEEDDASSSDEEEEEEEEGGVDCVCGVTDASPGAKAYTGLWVQCDVCGAWLHGACIGYPRRGPPGAQFSCMGRWGVVLGVTSCCRE